MTKLTITEALQEIKTIAKRVQSKRSAIGNYIARNTQIRDPLEKDGGSEKYITQERQAIADLENRAISIRIAIQRSNLDSSVAVADKTRTVQEWLTWRREISAGQRDFLALMAGTIARVRQQTQQSGGRVVAAAVAINESPDPAGPPHVVVNVDEKALIEDQEKIETVLGELDGKLSLFNATTTIEI